LGKTGVSGSRAFSGWRGRVLSCVVGTIAMCVRWDRN
jgi:hypothetical protein